MAEDERADAVVPVFFVSDSTGISAETMGNALLIQFPGLHFDRHLLPFITTVEEARRVVAVLDAAMAGPVTPLAFSTTAVTEIRDVLHTTTCPLIDFFDLHMSRVESILGRAGQRVAAQLHGVGDVKRYNARMAAVEYAIEHDDGQSLRALDKADVILLGPSRCGKTPTTMYLALQHGVFVANYPLVPEDLETTDLPRPVVPFRDRCFGLLTTPARLSQVRNERRANSRYASLERYRIAERGAVLVEGRAIGQKIGAGQVRVLSSLEEMHGFSPGDVLVADMTDPDWEPIMKRASAIVTNRGGRTCHAAIIARELGIPAVVGTGSATRDLADGRPVTVSCAEGDAGFVYDGELEFTVESTDPGEMPEIPVKIMMNVGTPDQAFAFSRLPNAGVGLARLEFIINRQIGIHPKALLDFDRLEPGLKEQIAGLTKAYPSPREYFVSRVTEGVAMLAAAFAPHPVIVRMSDFKSNEYANLLGGELYEPHEENPMIGYRGASRYLSPDFAECFAMECEALSYVRDTMGLTNVKIMIPFVRTLAEARGVVELLGANGLRRGENELEVIMMCELPSNAVIADAFLDHFDGFSIGSNDMTQLTLGLDRDSALVAAGFDERDPAVKFMLSAAITACRARGKYVGNCGQGPSDHPDLAEWLLEQGIDSLSLNPDTVVETWVRLGRRIAEQAEGARSGA